MDYIFNSYYTAFVLLLIVTTYLLIVISSSPIKSTCTESLLIWQLSTYVIGLFLVAVFELFWISPDYIQVLFLIIIVSLLIIALPVGAYYYSRWNILPERETSFFLGIFLMLNFGVTAHALFILADIMKIGA